MLENTSIIAWLQGMKTETGKPVDLKSHYWQYDIFLDESQILVARKAAQAGFTTLHGGFKKPYMMKKYGLDAIYTLPTGNDANDLSKGKFGRLIENNPDKMGKLISDMNTIHQKRIGNNVLYIIGTWTQKSAMMHSSDFNTYDELDASNPEVIEQMATRLQHSKWKFEHMFSHPSVPSHGVDRLFKQSDQKHWFVKCKSCKKKQILTFKKNIAFEINYELPPLDKNRVTWAKYICKYCKKELSNKDRAIGEWVKKYKGRSVSGYQISLLMNVNTTAKEIVEYWDRKSQQYFYNKVLGLPYAGAGNTITWEMFEGNLLGNQRRHDPSRHGRVIIGLDTGLTQYYVLMDELGIFRYGKCSDFKEIYRLLDYYKDSICVADGLGELLETRKMKDKYKGRVFINFYTGNRKTDETIRWGEKDKFGEVLTDRNRITQTVVDEIGDGNFNMWGDKSIFYDLFLHLSNAYRIKNEKTAEYKWIFTKPDHWFHALIYARIGISKFSRSTATFVYSKPQKQLKKGIKINPDGTASSAKLLKASNYNKQKKRYDWRRI
jgi:hypothetical protein